MSSAHACTFLRGNAGLQTLRILTLLFCLTAAEKIVWAFSCCTTTSCRFTSRIMLSCAPLALADVATQQVLLYSRLINSNGCSARSVRSFPVSPPVMSEIPRAAIYQVLSPIMARVIAFPCSQAGATFEDEMASCDTRSNDILSFDGAADGLPKARSTTDINTKVTLPSPASDWARFLSDHILSL